MNLFGDQVRRFRPEFGSAGIGPANGALLFSCMAIFLVILYTSSGYTYFYERGTDIKPLHWHLLVLCLAGVAVLARPSVTIQRFPVAILIWLGIYMAQLLISFLVSSQTSPAMDQLIYGLETTALLFSFIILLLLAPQPKVIIGTLVVVVLFSVGLNFYDFVFPTFSDTIGRAAGYYVNPNTAGKIISIAMVLSAIAVPRRLRMAYCLFVGLGILVTFSRSSWLLWAIGVTGLAATGQLYLRTRGASIILFGSVSIVIVYALFTGLMLDAFQVFGLDRYLGVDAIARLGGSGSAFEDASTAARSEMVGHSLSMFQQHPWFGAGLGATSEWLTLDRPHNLYLMVAVEAGVFGLLVLFAFIAILWFSVNPIGRVVVIMYSVSSLFAHTNLIQAHMLFLLAILIVVFSRQQESAQGVAPSHVRPEY